MNCQIGEGRFKQTDDYKLSMFQINNSLILANERPASYFSAASVSILIGGNVI